ncbi:MAG: NADH-quinone oxidoreductase subunit NuoH [Gemmatimonadetes bacterium]|nr:NADH-quinone oxidoreductase subunit NuoH [Gemmatimonadota bacterium]
MTPEMKGFVLLAVLKILAVYSVMNVGVMMVIWAERRVSAWKQDRLGPNRVGPQGLLQSVADGLKNFMKEETWPTEANKPLFLLAPLLSFVPAMLTVAVIPFAAPLPVNFDFAVPVLGQFVHAGPMPMIIADVPIGLLFIVAISSLSVYGIVLAGWSSNNKYSLLGGLRASAQMVSYEVALGFSFVGVLMLVGNVSLPEIVAHQQSSVWFVFALMVSFIFFFVSTLAETNRLPFDMPESESELVAGYHTEYSSMKFSMFFIAEYAHIITGSALMATMFLGGWDLPFTSWDSGEPSVLKSLITLGAFSLKTLFFIYVFIWIRWTLPRFRFDQVMQLGWKFMLPVLLAYILVLGATVLILDSMGWSTGLRYGLALFGMNLAVAYAVFFLLDNSRLMSGRSRSKVRA